MVSTDMERMPRETAIEFAQDRLNASAAVLATPEAKDVLRELAAAAGAAWVLRRLRGMPAMTIEQQIAATADFFDCGAARAVSVAALLTIRGDMGAPESPTTIDPNLN